jgi:hypothetical protein
LVIHKERIMKPIVSIALVLGLAGAAVVSAQTGTPPPDRPTQERPPAPADVVVAEKTTVTAKVAAVDPTQRTLTLQGPDGTEATIKVPEDVPNFDKIQVGDTVVADYLQTVAVAIQKAGAPAPRQEKIVEVAPPDHTPAAIEVDTIETTARVDAIDPNKRTVTLRGPDGTPQTITISPAVEGLRDIKPGDQIVIRRTEAVALAVTPS